MPEGSNRLARVYALRATDMLRVHAQTLMAEGTLPRSVPLRSIAGLGSDLKCALCGELVVNAEPEVEVYFLRRAFEPYFFHRGCYVIWFAESLTKFKREESRRASGALTPRPLSSRVTAHLHRGLDDVLIHYGGEPSLDAPTPARAHADSRRCDVTPFREPGDSG